ncbi:hypothetical protein DFH11DRAFT_327245 [Phellopilus nigrolimitatus]|nr:hypothetical protein DFH11DRAFT_327245 [Phellopilus nigrolimitatus]
MDYTPRHSQPFTFGQALQLEIPTIATEISRLENSLQHLNQTQDELNEHLSGSSEDDRELLDAVKENNAVIASQKERISMLKMALEAKGINTSSAHYNPTSGGGALTTAMYHDSSPAQTSQPQLANGQDDEALANHGEDEDAGMYL